MYFFLLLTTRVTGATFFRYRVAGAGQVLSIALTSPLSLLFSVWYSPEMECDVFHAYVMSNKSNIWHNNHSTKRQVKLIIDGAGGTYIICITTEFNISAVNKNHNNEKNNKTKNNITYRV